MDRYDIDADGYLLGAANAERGYDGVTPIPPPLETIPPSHCRWVRGAWVADRSRADARTRGDQQAAVVQAVQARLDSLAQSWGYDSILSLATYASSRRARFAAEGKAGADFRDDTWDAVGKHQSALSIEALLPALPPIPDRPAP